MSRTFLDLAAGIPLQTLSERLFQVNLSLLSMLLYMALQMQFLHDMEDLLLLDKREIILHRCDGMYEGALIKRVITPSWT
jgi:hypothetical protein